MTKATAARIGEEWESYVAKRAAAIPVARAGRPEDVAHTVSFLVGDGAGFVSGQVVHLAGGPRVQRPRPEAHRGPSRVPPRARGGWGGRALPR
jgi:NAD(P)-dependent dehydrogenase (short-subunit alcohol dehydrogenase family)